MTFIPQAIFIDDHSCRIGLMDPKEPSSPCRYEGLQLDVNTLVNESAQQMATLLKRQSYAGQGLVLIIPTRWCLCVTVSANGLPVKSRRQGLLFRLEERLPIAAEQLVADFLPSGDCSLAVGTLITRIAPIIEALETEGVAIEVVTTASWLALRSTKEVDSHQDCDVVLWGDGDRLEMFIITSDSTQSQTPVNAPSKQSLVDEISATNYFRSQQLLSRLRPWTATAVWKNAQGNIRGSTQGNIRGWYQCRQDVNDLRWLLNTQALQTQDPVRITARSVDEPILEWLKSQGYVELTVNDKASLETAAIHAARPAALGKIPGLINLRRAGLTAQNRLLRARTPLRFALASALLFMTTLNALFLFHAHRYQLMVRDNESRQRAVFARLFPNRPVPIGVQSRLHSEKARIAAVRGRSDQSPDQASALTLLHTILSLMPNDPTYRLLELRFDGDKVYMEGQARSHGVADGLATALSADDRLAIDQPRTEQLAGGGVAFTLTGQVIANPQPRLTLAKRAPR